MIVPKPAPATLGASATMPLPVVEDCGTFGLYSVHAIKKIEKLRSKLELDPLLAQWKVFE